MAFEKSTPADRWMQSGTQQLIQRVTYNFTSYEYAAAKADTEAFFWNFTDNYLEFAKQRLYDDHHPLHFGAIYTLQKTFLTIIKLFAPILPHVTEQVYKSVFSSNKGESIHTSPWPIADERLINKEYDILGNTLIEVATGVRRFKSKRNLSLGTTLKRLQLASGDGKLRNSLSLASVDLQSITRALKIEVKAEIDPDLEFYSISPNLKFGINA
jgi:valyl-tRNA synthetase